LALWRVIEFLSKGSDHRISRLLNATRQKLWPCQVGTSCYQSVSLPVICKNSPAGDIATAGFNLYQSVSQSALLYVKPSPPSAAADVLPIDLQSPAIVLCGHP
jgi:hypothetical protein